MKQNMLHFYVKDLTTKTLDKCSNMCYNKTVEKKLLKRFRQVIGFLKKFLFFLIHLCNYKPSCKFLFAKRIHRRAYGCLPPLPHHQNCTNTDIWGHRIPKYQMAGASPRPTIAAR